MVHKHALHALDRSLKDIRNDNTPMGGITMLFAGDSCQTLPVVKRGTRGDTVRACIKYSYLWPKINQLPPFVKNMRLIEDDEEYSRRLQLIGRGLYPETENHDIKYDEFASKVETIEELMQKVWGMAEEIEEKDDEWKKDRAILCPTNVSVREETVYKSIDRTVDENDTVHFPVEFLNSLNDSGLHRSTN